MLNKSYVYGGVSKKNYGKITNGQIEKFNVNQKISEKY